METTVDLAQLVARLQAQLGANAVEIALKSQVIEQQAKALAVAQATEKKLQRRLDRLTPKD